MISNEPVFKLHNDQSVYMFTSYQQVHVIYCTISILRVVYDVILISEQFGSVHIIVVHLVLSYDFLQMIFFIVMHSIFYYISLKNTIL